MRLIDKWLDVGVIEGGNGQASDGKNTGGEYLTRLDNVYLHYVLDLWVEQWRKRDARGEMIVVRCADDLVTSFEFDNDAVRFLAGLKKGLPSLPWNSQAKRPG